MSANHSMSPQDRDFWIAVGLWGAALATVFGYGLYAFIEQSYWYGGGFTSAGLGGLVYLAAHLKGHRLSPRAGAMATMLAVTWALIGYQILHPDQTGKEIEAQKSILIEWLEQSQHERDQARQGHAAAEAQRTTMVEWLQSAQRERDAARQQYDQLQKDLQAQRSRSASQTYPLRPPPTAAEECVRLAQRIAELDPARANEKVQAEHIRSTMTALGCGCDASKK
jgi:hypothetical protein